LGVLHIGHGLFTWSFLLLLRICLFNNFRHIWY
jgi:hypothetical protein